MFLRYHPSSWGWWYIWAASVFKEFMRKEWSDFKSTQVEDLRTSHATLSASYVAGMIGMGRGSPCTQGASILNEKIHPWMLTFRSTYPTPWCWMSVSTTSVSASTFPSVHLFFFGGNFRVILHQLIRCKIFQATPMCDMHNESPSCPALRIAYQSPKNWGPCGQRKQADAGEKRERETQIVFTFDPAGKHAWQTLSQLCLLSATCVLGEHLGWPCWPFHSAFLARWRHRTLFSCSSSLRG